jgi:hypothetical protein
MAHFAEIDNNNIVLRVVVVKNVSIEGPRPDRNEEESLGIELCQNLFGGSWVQTSYNRSFRKNFAAAGFTYDSVRDAFIPPKPFESWILNEDDCRWYAPVPKPEGEYIWDEDNLQWVLE